MRIWRWIIWGIVVLVVLVAGYLAAKRLHLDANLITALLTLVTAITAAYSANLSSKAASESSSAAQDAVRALSWSAKPTMNVAYSYPALSDHHLVYIQNDSIHPVAEATVRWTLRDGTKGERTYGKLDGRAIPVSNVWVAGDWGKHYEPIDRGEWAPAEGQDTYVIDYRGVNGPTTWRTTLVLTYVPQPQPDGTVAWSYRKQRISDIELH